MNWYFKQVATHPLIIIFTIGTFSVACFVFSITNAKIPNFSDPQLGFETRGTEIAQRLTAWDNLYEAVRPSGHLTANPLGSHQSLVNEISSKAIHNFLSGGKVSHDVDEEQVDEQQPEQKAGKLHSDHNHDHDHLSSDGFFCEGLSPDYSHFVVEATDSQSLLSYKSLHSICILQQRLMNQNVMSSICQTISNEECCKPWSLPNYIALLLNHSTCSNITEENVQEVKSLFMECSQFFNQLLDCNGNIYCPGVPPKCTENNVIFNVLYYLTDVNFSNFNHSNVILNHTMIFLPIARSSAVLDFYYNLSVLKENNIQISGIDFGLKNALFNDQIIRDGYLMVAGSAFMLVCIWSYTKSLFITISTILAVVMSLIYSYFIYTFIFNIKFFPFMNLLAIVVAVGIGADDAFIFYKMWTSFKTEKDTQVVKLVSDTLKHSSASMFVTSLTTAAAFYSNYVGFITAINCFSVFAGTAVLTNFLLMVSWFPACVVVSQKLNCRFPRVNVITINGKRTSQVKLLLHKYLELIVVRHKWMWLFIFTVLAIGSAMAVLYYPKLRLPHSRNFHLFQSNHLFERYDSYYKDKFRFEMQEQGWESQNFKLPLRFVWGILPIDNGNFLEPSSKGTLEFDLAFDIAAPESQAWLLNFCQNLRAQPFYQLTLGPLLSNCFIESFQSWMQRRCVDVNGIDQTPCCESSKFPYPREVFHTCIVKAISRLFETPANYIQSGVAGPKFLKNKEEIRVVVVEYDSNHSYSMSFQDMHDFYLQVETWFQQQLLTAPPGMKNGWFVSHLGFYDLQVALSNGTALAIGVSMAISLAVFFLVTLNILISIYTILTISCIVFVTVGCLVLMGWTINILESIAVTAVIGLSVDFSLHYGISYSFFIEDNRESAVRFALKRMGGPTLMAALTTGAAGLFMLPSSVLAYIQIGIFLIIVMATSWLYSTIFLMSLLVVAGPRKGFGQLSYRSVFSIFRKFRLKTFRPDAHQNEDEILQLETLRGSTKHIQCIAAS